MYTATDNCILFDDDPKRVYDKRGRLISLKYSDGCGIENTYDDEGFIRHTQWNTEEGTHHDHYEWIDGKAFRVLGSGILQAIRGYNAQSV